MRIDPLDRLENDAANERGSRRPWWMRRVSLRAERYQDDGTAWT